jgi:O-acetyl-ADP-ribose deacetylase (regulator of RNase III)
MMKETIGDLWTLPAEARVIPTNGVVHKGKLVMGAGVALQAKLRYPELPSYWGRCVTETGNQCYTFGLSDEILISFPTKHYFRGRSSLALIEQSCQGLLSIVRLCLFQTIVLPRVGCGLGGQDWEGEVKPLLSCYLDDRFIVVWI